MNGTVGVDHSINRRITDIDALRGFALLGILVVNISYIASPHHFRGAPDPTAADPLDHAVRWLVVAGFETKFYLLFSFLFGYSFTLQLRSAERVGASFAPRFLRRLSGLFVLGTLHAVLLFPGDILTLYALLGLVLLALRRITSQRALNLALVVTVLSAAAFACLGVVLAATGYDGSDVYAQPEAERALHDLRGGVGSVIATHLAQLPIAVTAIVFGQAPVALAAFLVGFAAGTRRIFDNPGRVQQWSRKLRTIGYPIGATGALVYAWASVTHPGAAAEAFAFAVDVVTAPLLAAAYASTVVHALHTSRGSRLAALLAPAGRMSLSNYLGQSVANVLLFTGIGFGLAGRLGPASLLAVALLIYAAQVGLSRWWMRRFQYGPLEWVLRSWTTLALPRLRRDPPVVIKE
ncbi:DUF418 domain-containing protein [Dactylosporangium roseum]|uniref:DUF418 domain-containing protein n=1 Tax=Dactylosporangium roseum TaxID=47989 RepID=UPI0021B425FA|nr:DUF418 domain-containing protein [Dactylosporangium roseum]